jgi:hypothetical protein
MNNFLFAWELQHAFFVCINLAGFRRYGVIDRQMAAKCPIREDQKPTAATRMAWNSTGLDFLHCRSLPSFIASSS